MSVVVLPSANQVIRQFADFPDVDMRFNSKADFETAIVNVARIPDGWMAYCIAEKNWFFADKAAGTATAFGTGEGSDGKSAYQVAVDNGFVGTETEWLASLQGVDGTNGTNGVGVPTGGTAGQVLKKSTNDDFDTEWGDAASEFSNLDGDPHDNPLLDAELDRIEAIADEAINSIGDLDNLQTTNKTNIVNALNEVETDVSNSSQDQTTLRIFKVSNYGTL